MVRPGRHNRSAAFEAAPADPALASATRWHEIADDPNDPRVIARRAGTLQRALRPPIRDRVAELQRRCAGRSVLDIGCVAHDEARMDQPSWLHARLAEVAGRIMGVDILESGVRAMEERGYHAVVHNLSDGLGPLTEHAPFDVIVAGEVIEHVEDLGMLFATAAAGLAPDGELLITTPNPWAPARVRAGQRGDVWENVDHILLAFPTGIAELAERHGLELAEAFTTAQFPTPVTRPKTLAKVAYRWLRGSRYASAGYATVGRLRPVQIAFGRVGSALRGMWRPGRRFVGETAIYVVRRSSR